jgi:hypothetical protein
MSSNVQRESLIQWKENRQDEIHTGQFKGRIWPLKPSCEMNMTVWKEELRTYKLEKKYRHIIRGFEHGFDQGIRNGRIPKLRFFCPKNHKSALQAREKIEENFKLEVEKGRMFGP